jgi:Sigma-70 region 2
MTRQSAQTISRQIQTLFTAGSFSGLSDRQLLDRFTIRHDAGSEAAFAVLLERHGPLVLGVCRRILYDAHDAEDAFQATFLVLVQCGDCSYSATGHSTAVTFRLRRSKC